MVTGNSYSASISKFINKPEVHNAMVFYIYGLNGFKNGATFGFNNIRVIDLTETYGVGNEPTSIEQVKKDLHI